MALVMQALLRVFTLQTPLQEQLPLPLTLGIYCLCNLFFQQVGHNWYPLNQGNYYFSNPSASGYVGTTPPVYYNATLPNETAFHGSQHYYGYAINTPYPLAGTWRARGHARGRGINQGFLNGTLMERIA
jgi:hypothetical protein